MEVSEALRVFAPDDDHSHDFCRKEDGSSFVNYGFGCQFNNYGFGCQFNNLGFGVTWDTSYVVGGPPKVPPFAPKDDESSIQRSLLAFDQDSNLARVGSSPQVFVPDDDAPTVEQWSGKIYGTLHPSNKFRLLEVLPGSGGSIQCKLHVCGLDKNEMAYEALSYTWGNDQAWEKKKIEITAKGASRSLTISRNLHDALLALRLSNKSRFIWADAVCINQDDAKERSQQVRLMGSIFGGAWRVVIWVGEQGDRCHCGERLLEFLPGSLTESLSGICLLVNTWLAQQGRLDIKASFSTVSASGASSEEDNRSLAANTQDGAAGNFGGSQQQLRSSVLLFFERHWFSRIWVVQESVLARNAVVQLGPHQISWDWIGIAAAILVHSPFLSSDGSRRDPIPAEVNNAYFMYRLSASQTYFEPLKFSFVQLLHLTRLFESTEERDKIYGLMGLPATDSIAELIVPDYSEETRVEKIYEDIAWLILGSKSPLRLLSGAGTFGRFTCSGPSWIPRWHMRRPWTILHTGSHPQFGCASRTSMQIDSAYQRSELALRGVIVDKIGSIQEDRPWMLPVFPKAGAETLDSFLHKVSWNMESWQKCAMTLTCGNDSMSYPVDDIVSHLSNFAAALLSGKLDWALKDLIELDKPNRSEVGSVVGLDELKVPAQNGQADRYVSAAAPVFDSYRVFVSDSSIFGMGPVDMKVGDLLCVLFGAEVPFLLRPYGDGYVVVGECYAYDVMHGEVLDTLDSNPDGPLKATWLKLI